MYEMCAQLYHDRFEHILLAKLPISTEASMVVLCCYLPGYDKYHFGA
jgi:hypothetical protein